MDRLSHLAQVVSARLSGSDATFSGFSIDTRSLQSGEVFVALSGERVDGHEFVAMAARQGAAAALVARWQDVDLPQLVVPDVLAALQAYTQHWRLQFDIPVIGVTGSNGKTTTKEMLAAILSEQGPVLATRGNLNNHIGVPLTLAAMRAEHQSAVVEMGANHPGEIAELAAIAGPTAGVVTLAAAAHLEGFGDIDTVARTKGGLFASLPADGLAVINADDDYADLWKDMAGHCRQLTFGLRPSADVYAASIAEGMGDDGMDTHFLLCAGDRKQPVALPLPGRHNVMNALAASAIAVGLGMSLEGVASALSKMPSVAGRLRVVSGVSGARIVDDSYNANPSSTRAALQWLQTQSGRRWLALGDMAELGEDSLHWHHQAGEWAREAGIECLLTLGPLSQAALAAFGEGGLGFDSHDEMLTWLRAELAGDVTLLVKGSRTAQMDLIVAGLVESTARQAANGG